MHHVITCHLHPPLSCPIPLLSLRQFVYSAPTPRSGDSRSILISGDAAVPLSFDHKPTNDEEKQRILDAGGSVAMGRVNGDLAVSRAFGDFSYKTAQTLGPRQQMVTVLPEILHRKRDVSRDQFVVLACDGIWDVMSNEDVAAYVLDKIVKGTAEVGEDGKEKEGKVRDGPVDLGRICEQLIDTCLGLGSRDNMSVIIVELTEGKAVGKAGG